MSPKEARLILEAWRAKLAGQPPTPREAKIVERYQAIAEGADMVVYDYLNSAEVGSHEEL